MVEIIQIGDDIVGKAGDHSGRSVSLSGNGSVVAIGSPFAVDLNALNSYITDQRNDPGSVKIFKNDNNNWTQIGEDLIGAVNGDHFGYSISLSYDGSIVAIGTPYNDDNGIQSGHVKIYKNSGNQWNQIGNDIQGKGANDHSGASVSISDDGSFIAIGTL